MPEFVELLSDTAMFGLVGLGQVFQVVNFASDDMFSF